VSLAIWTSCCWSLLRTPPVAVAVGKVGIVSLASWSNQVIFISPNLFIDLASEGQDEEGMGG
jgi:hypothetical protein